MLACRHVSFNVGDRLMTAVAALANLSTISAGIHFLVGQS